MNLGGITKPLTEKMSSLVEILQETLDTLKLIEQSNNQIVAKLELLNESINNKDDKDK